MPPADSEFTFNEKPATSPGPPHPRGSAPMALFTILQYPIKRIRKSPQNGKYRFKTTESYKQFQEIAFQPSQPLSQPFWYREIPPPPELLHNSSKCFESLGLHYTPHPISVAFKIQENF